MNRGLSRRPIFEHRTDARKFMALTARVARRGDLEVHTFNLMTNHFHMLARSPRGELWSPMRWIQAEYARYFNRSRGRRGPLFESRYTSKIANHLGYRRLVVRYIDDNPVAAKLVAQADHYPYGSAMQYARRHGPLWLSRYWVEEEVSPNGAYDPRSYSARFPTRLSQDLRQWVERRLESESDADPFEDLIAATSVEVRQWMEEQAALADGERVGCPVVAEAQVMRTLENSGLEPWSIHRGRKLVDAWRLASPGLLRSLCALTAGQIAARLGIAESTVRHRVAAHRETLLRDPAYAARCAKLATDAITAMRAEFSL